MLTGYSSLAVALALPPEGQITACDISEEYTSIARRYWAEAGVSGKIDLRIGPAADTLDTLITSGLAGASISLLSMPTRAAIRVITSNAWL